MIRLKQLPDFTSIAHHGNLSLAAAELFLTKGALSQSLAQLERQLGQPLFDRVHPHLQLNERGRQLQPLAEEVLSRIYPVPVGFSLASHTAHTSPPPGVVCRPWRRGCPRLS